MVSADTTMIQVVKKKKTLRDMKLGSHDGAGQGKTVWLETGSTYKGNTEHLADA